MIFFARERGRRGCAAALLACFFFAVPALCGAQRRFCVRVIDGDTIILENGERVRLLGVDAPEIAHYGHAGEAGGEGAREFLRKLVEGRVVNLEYDAERKDKFGRTLAYVFTADGRFVNLLLIEEGHAEAMRFFDYREKERFLGIKRVRGVE